jgi:hypothetical protein
VACEPVRPRSRPAAATGEGRSIRIRCATSAQHNRPGARMRFKSRSASMLSRRRSHQACPEAGRHPAHVVFSRRWPGYAESRRFRLVLPSAGVRIRQLHCRSSCISGSLSTISLAQHFRIGR